jgi:hypothetical protein
MKKLKCWLGHHDYELFIYYDRSCSLHRCRRCGKEFYIDTDESYRTDNYADISVIATIHENQLNQSRTELIRRTETMKEIASSPENIKKYAGALKKDLKQYLDKS